MPIILVGLSNTLHNKTPQQQAHPHPHQDQLAVFSLSKMTPPCKSLYVCLVTALTAYVHFVSASPFPEGFSATGSAGYGAAFGSIEGNIGDGCGQGNFGDDCSSNVPVQPTIISPETDFLPVTNVLPQVNVLPTAFNDHSCDDGYGGDLGNSGYGGTFGCGGGVFGYGGGAFGC